MQEFALSQELHSSAPINGVYLSSEQIDLLSIIQCRSIEELREFATNCSQLNISEAEASAWQPNELEAKKRELFKKFQETLIPMKQAIEDRISVVRSALVHSGIPEDEIELYSEAFQKGGYNAVIELVKTNHPDEIELYSEAFQKGGYYAVIELVKNNHPDEIDSYKKAFQKGGYNAVIELVKTNHPDEYAEIAKKAHRFIGTERDELRSVTYEEMSGLNEALFPQDSERRKHNTILVASGRYYDVTNALYDSSIPEMQKYDFYHQKRELDFCVANGMYARYHALLDKQTMEEHFEPLREGENPEEHKARIIQELSDYVKQSIDFIKEYNRQHQIDGRGAITSVDLFNEIVSFDPPYRNMWQELHGISLEDLAQIFRDARENKPEGVTYVYNEPFLENDERREVVLDIIRRINETSPGLIDTIGTQMHIDITQSPESIEQCFTDLRKLKENTGIGAQITEFDMCIPERFMFDKDGRISTEYSPEFIYDYKAKRMAEISDIIRRTGVELDGITYWSTTDHDHNVQRTNEKTYKEGLQRETARTRYSGLYTGLERVQTITTRQFR
ncbi:MAG: endo-1,4-beta-xylanase [Clostridia bacterium]|nr:endo-1,4-beta-xylanase [Clostridia bacterium]